MSNQTHFMPADRQSSPFAMAVPSLPIYSSPSVRRAPLGAFIDFPVPLAVSVRRASPTEHFVARWLLDTD